MTVVNVGAAIGAKEHLARGQNGASQGFAKNAVAEGGEVAVEGVIWLEILQLGQQFWGEEVIGIEGKTPGGLDLGNAKVPLGGVGVEGAPAPIQGINICPQNTFLKLDDVTKICVL